MYLNCTEPEHLSLWLRDKPVTALTGPPVKKTAIPAAFAGA